VGTTNVVYLNSTFTPKELDISVTRKGRRTLMKGIYKFEGQRLRYCLAPTGEPRPSSFDVPTGSKRTLVSLNRVPHGEFRIEGLLQNAVIDLGEVDAQKMDWVTFAMTTADQNANTLTRDFLGQQYLNLQDLRNDKLANKNQIAFANYSIQSRLRNDLPYSTPKGQELGSLIRQFKIDMLVTQVDVDRISKLGRQSLSDLADKTLD
jgi:hypothetical protein